MDGSAFLLLENWVGAGGFVSGAGLKLEIVYFSFSFPTYSMRGYLCFVLLCCYVFKILIFYSLFLD